MTVHRTRVPGPIIKTQTVGNTAENEVWGDAPWKSLDVNDGTWTEANPGSHNTLVSAITTDADGMRIQMDYSTHSANNFNSGNKQLWDAATMNPKRYYKKLQGPNGDIRWDQAFNIEFLAFRQSNDANDGTAGPSNNKWDGAGVVVGVADGDIIDTVSNLNWVGAGFYTYTSNGSVMTEIGGDLGVTEISNTDAVKGLAQLGINLNNDDADNDTRIVRGVGYALNNENEVEAHNGLSQQTFEFEGDDPVYLFLAPAFMSTLSDVDTDTDAKWKIWYRLRISTENVSPVYIPGGGISR